MSWDVSLIDGDGCVCQVAPHEEGGTYVLGGTTAAWLSITYNYGRPYSLIGFELKALEWSSAKYAAIKLERAICALGTNRYRDYWAPTPGNAGYALSILLRWAKQHPDARFEVR